MAFLMIFNIDLGALSTQGKLATYMMAIYTSLCLKTIVYWATQKNISLTWNTDGVPLFKSSSFALWPLYFIVNELPYNKRIQRENMIFAGFCFGTNKLFFSPFYDGLSKLDLGALSTQGKLATYMMAIYTSLCLKTIVYWATQKNISLTWNTDGVPLFKSSSFALWPLYFIVNELPYNKRIQRENMIFAGFCFGTNKLFFSPFYDGLSKLEAEGINITIPGETACSFNSKVIVICGTCDLPAKCMVCNTIQYNGFYGCCKCKNKNICKRTHACFSI